MRKLYWKIFIWFWIAMTLTIIIIALVSSKVTQHSTNRLQEQAFIETVSSAANMVMQDPEQDQFRKWSRYLDKRFDIKTYMVPVHQPFPPVTPPNPRLEHLVDRIQHQPLPVTAFSDQPFFVSAPITTPGGEKARIVLRLPEHITNDFNFSWPDIILKTVIAILISGFICYLLSLYLSRPIRVLQRAARRLGRGDLSTRVGKEFSKRRDEIAELGHEFDDMASKLQILMHERQQLLQDISHELRSPLARLSVALEIARQKNDDGDHPELDRIEKESERLNELIGKILSLASISTKNNETTTEECNLNSLIHDVVDDANFEMQREHSPIKLQSKGDFIISGNAELLRSAIDNIIRNALRYTPNDSNILVCVAQKNNLIEISITDNGPGIPEDKVHHIFEPFYRVDDSRTSKTGGYGLGLAIAKKAILLHKGSITAENIQSGGLMVKITLPS